MPTEVTGRRVTGRPASPGYRADVLEVLTRLLAGQPGVNRGKWIHIHRSRAQTYSKDIALFQASIAFVGRMARQSRKSSNSKPLPNRS